MLFRSMHVLNRAIEAIAHPSLTSALNPMKILQDIKATHKSDVISYEIDLTDIVDRWDDLIFMTPETGSLKHPVYVEQLSDGKVKISVNVKELTLYGVIS